MATTAADRGGVSYPPAGPGYTERTLEMRAGNIHLREGGHGEPLLVLHHDIGCTGWSTFHQLLAERFFICAPDLPGFGQSDRPDLARHTRDLAIHLLLGLDQLKLERFSIVGLGYGGWVAAEMATMIQARCRRLVLVAPAGLKPHASHILDQFLLNPSDYVQAGFANPSSLQNHFGDPVDAETAWAWDLAREMTARINWKPYMFSQQLPYLLPDVIVPTLVVFGGKDNIVPPECGDLYTALVPNSRLRLLPDAGHFVDLEFPEELANLVATHIAS